MLEKNIFIEDYSSDQSPKVQISWRKNQGIKRNEAWELDRVLHAIAVYLNVVKFRRIEIDIFGTNDPISKYIKSALCDGIDALDYLSENLTKFSDFFTKTGYSLVLEFREKVLQEIKKAKKVIT